MKQLIPSIMCCFLCLNLTAQPLTAFVDNQYELMVWDKGYIRKVDFLPPVEMKIGRTAIPYLDNSRSFKIYYGGNAETINPGLTNAFFATDNLVGFLNQKSLNVFDRGNTKNLTSICNQYFIDDSIVVYLNGVKTEYRAYYNGETYPIETYVPDSILTSVKVAHNLVAFNNFSNQFKIFFHGAIIPQEDYPITSYDVGRNTVAYVDADKKFKIFHDGQTYVVEDFAPASYHVGDNLVAYVSSDNYFKIFYGDSVRTIGFFHPTFRVKDNIVAYKDPGGIFKIFFKGDITEMESYYPAKYVIQYNSVAYVNTSGTLRLFTEGETFDVTNADLADWQLNYDVIKYQIGQAIFKVFYKGNEY